MREIKPKTKKRMACAGLLITTMIWGSSFVIMKQSVDIITPAYLLAIRFTIAALALCFVFYKKVLLVKKADLLGGTVLGILLFLSFLFQTYGLKYTSASKNAFITTFYVILVPFILWILYKIRPGKNQIAAAVIALLGIGLLSLKGNLTISVGDGLTLICSIAFALHIIFIDRFTIAGDPVILTILQIIVAALLSWITAPILEGKLVIGHISGDLMICLFYLGIVSTMICFLLQNVCQRYLSPNTSSILLSFESIFGLLFSVVLLEDTLTLKLLMGCFLIFIAVIISEYKYKISKVE